jgi:2-oxoglutarate dehydrogenase complex dehydrogenase (E1) component-like enzyme
MFTQPIMYSIIKKHKNVLDKYSDQLVAEGVCTKEEVAEVIGNYEQVVFLLFARFSMFLYIYNSNLHFI